MARLYSARLLAVGAATGFTTVVVPAGQLWVVRDLDVATAPGVGGVIALGDSRSGTWFADVWTPGSAWHITPWRGRQVLDAGDTLSFYQSGAGNAAVSGYKLDLP